MRGAGNEAAYIRRLGRADRPRLRDHLLRLDPDSRYERFAVTASDDLVEDYAAHSLGPDDLAFGYWADGVLRGVGELRGLGRSGAEIAVSVEQEWQGRGIGSALVGRLVAAAAVRGETTLRVTCLPYNRAMQKIMRDLSPHMRFSTIRAGADEAPLETFDNDSYSAVLDLRPRARRLQPA